jgi:hypothetical protein
MSLFFCLLDLSAIIILMLDVGQGREATDG